jgi:hypothetical protein
MLTARTEPLRIAHLSEQDILGEASTAFAELKMSNALVKQALPVLTCAVLLYADQP